MSKPKSLLFLIIVIVVLLMPTNNPLTHAVILHPWTTLSSTPLPKPLYLHSSVVSNGYIFVLGGISSTSSISVYVAKINSDGTIGAWSTRLRLPKPLSGLSAVASNGYIFYLGGREGSFVHSEVWSAKINSDETLGDWTHLCMTPLPKGLEHHSSVVSNEYIFVMGGASNSSLYESAVYSAKVNPNGTLGAWTTLSSTPLPKVLKHHSSVSSNGYLFVLGGDSSASNAESTVYSAKVNSDGTLGVWTELNSTPLPQGLYSHSSVASNDYIFVMGGALSTGSLQSTVYAAKVNSDGTLGSWMTLSSAPLPKAINLFPSVIENEYIFVLGGQSDSFFAESAVYSAKVDDQGPVTSNSLLNPNPLPVNTPITLTGNVDDSQTGGSNIASAEYNIDGGNYSSMSAQDGSFNNTIEDVTATIPAFSVSAVLTVCARGFDRAGNVGNEDCMFLPVYDPNGGFVTGGGWIYSQPGSYIPDTSLEGKANFGFVSKYKKGANIPTGNTQFHFKVANLNFHSDTYEWLVIAGARAQFKGTGTINDTGNYGFMLTAIDSNINGGGNSDRFRIKIWNKDNNDTIVYDNELGLSDTGDPTTSVVEGGSVIIHDTK